VRRVVDKGFWVENVNALHVPMQRRTAAARKGIIGFDFCLDLRLFELVMVMVNWPCSASRCL